MPACPVSLEEPLASLDLGFLTHVIVASKGWPKSAEHMGMAFAG